jgi:hypothetical protein
VQTLLVVHRTQVGLQQTGEGLRLSPLAGLAGLRVVDVRQAVGGLVAVLLLVGLEEVVGAVALVGVEGLDQRVGEDLDVTGGFPDLTRLDDGGVHTDDILAGGHHVTPPLTLDVLLELHTQGAVVPGGAGTAVDLAGREDQASALTEVDDGIDAAGRHVFRHAPREAHGG